MCVALAHGFHGVATFRRAHCRMTHRALASSSKIPETLRLRILKYLDLRHASKHDALVDPLSYSELIRLGFDDLVEPIIKEGGYVAVSMLLGLKVSTLPQSNQDEPMAKSEFQTRRSIEGELSLGSALEDKISEVSLIRSTPARFEAGIKSFPRDDLMDFPARSEKSKLKLPEESVVFTLPERMYFIALSSSLALGSGHASSEAILRGFLNPAIQETAEAISFGFLVANVLSAVLSIRLASERRRAVSLWVFKSCCCGPLSLFELRGLSTKIDAAVDENNDELNNGDKRAF